MTRCVQVTPIGIHRTAAGRVLEARLFDLRRWAGIRSDLGVCVPLLSVADRAERLFAAPARPSLVDTASLGSSLGPPAVGW
jgi:hypothetical protein